MEEHIVAAARDSGASLPGYLTAVTARGGRKKGISDE